ncbi:MAG: hypothetical protein HC904_08910 [Blastochloris sp.]|nr:hypothetical protein [Blastochloris sp.]
MNEGPQGSLWILGYKTEGAGPLIETRDGARTEVLGGMVYPIDAPGENAAFVVDNASASFSWSETGRPEKMFRNQVRETQSGRTHTHTQQDAMAAGVQRGGRATGLYRAGP